MPFSDPIKQRQIQDIKNICDISTENSWKIFKIMAEFVEGYDLLSNTKNEVSIFGSARTRQDDKYYQEALKLGRLLAINKFSTITGGGPGIMEAANKGAFEAGGISIGLGIELPMEQRINPYVNKSVNFSYFFTRKVMLTAPSQAYVYFPGGFGTMDEFFQVINEQSLGFTQIVPIILVGVEFWTPLVEFLKDKCVDMLNSIEMKFINNISIVDTAEEAFEVISTTEDQPNMTHLAPNSNSSDLNLNWKIFKIMAEFVEGLEFQSNLSKNITVLGTNKIKSDNTYYKKAYNLAKIVAEEGYSLLTGGGKGTAEAINKASRESGKKSYAMVLRRSNKLNINEYVDDFISFKFPFTRQVLLTGPSNHYVIFPGGLGTLHQMFEVLTLIQTDKVNPQNIILYDKEFWTPMINYFQDIFIDKYKTINPGDMNLLTILDKEEDILDKI